VGNLRAIIQKKAAKRSDSRINSQEFPERFQAGKFMALEIRNELFKE
jgi:hypothetical protein